MGAAHLPTLASDALKPEEIDVPRAEQQLERGEQMWNEAGESEEACDDALRGLSEAETKISSASEKHKFRVNHQSIATINRRPG